MDSLTGDPITDALIPAAQQLVGAVRAGNADEIDEAFAAAIIATGGRCDPAVALAIVCAAMVPDDAAPSQLLAWRGPAQQYKTLIERGVDPRIARELTAIDPKGRVA